MDEELLRQLRHRAVDQHLSLSAWVIQKLEQVVEGEDSYENSRDRALARLAQGYHLGGRPLGRDEVHAR